jgi:hypothetical protein
LALLVDFPAKRLVNFHGIWHFAALKVSLLAACWGWMEGRFRYQVLILFSSWSLKDKSIQGVDIKDVNDIISIAFCWD